MADSFSIDPNLMNAVKDHAQNIQNAMGSTRDYVSQINDIMTDVNRVYADIAKNGQNLGLDPSLLSQLASIHKMFALIGSSVIKTSVNLTAEEVTLKKTLAGVQRIANAVRQKNKLIADELKLVRDETKAVHALNIGTQNLKKTNKKDKEEEEKKKKDKGPGYLKKEIVNVAQMSLSMAGLGDILRRNEKSLLGWQFSIAGIIKLFIDLMNKSNVIAGYSRMAAYSFSEWGKGPKETASAIGVTNRALLDVRSRFRMGFDEAGKLVTKLTQAGFESEDMGSNIAKAGQKTKDWQGTASRMLAIQTLQGRSVDSQLESIMNLRNNFGEMVTSAQTLDALIGDIGKKIPGLTAQDAVQSVLEMGRGMRFFTTDLLDSITLYHSLNNAAEEHRKKVVEARAHAKKTGEAYKEPAVTSPWGKTWVTAPQEVRKGLLQFLSSAPLTMDPGMMARLGKQGLQPAQRKAEFESAIEKGGQFEFLKRLTTDVIESTKHLGTPEDRQIGMEQYLTRQYSMPIEPAKFLARGITKGDLDIKGLQQLEAQLKKEEESMKKRAADRDSMMDKLLKSGVKVNSLLLTFEDYLKKLVEDKLIPMVTDLIAAIRELAGKLPDIKQVQENTDLIFRGPKGEKKFIDTTNKLRETDKGHDDTYGKMMGTIREVATARSEKVADKELDQTFGAARFITPTYFAEKKIVNEQMEGAYAQLGDPKKLLSTLLTDKGVRGAVMDKYGHTALKELIKAVEQLIISQEKDSETTKTEAATLKNKATAIANSKRAVKKAPGSPAQGAEPAGHVAPVH